MIPMTLPDPCCPLSIGCLIGFLGRVVLRASHSQGRGTSPTTCLLFTGNPRSLLGNVERGASVAQAEPAHIAPWLLFLPDWG